ncbi:hypothetical protein HUJ04_000557 [Dendroctonus ponderosae]|uniref:Uncharacterized protein n=1 Tax=Dendroctonus ponderosae TaxID=77166 RepID=A0AAR5Q0M1_DENPD|nr:hypothetical protein HUJ04_000557 [Dendroctonus ponderosae]
MNTRKAYKNKRRLVKSNSKAGKLGQDIRITESKSNIGSKRVTLLPGFLINGFTSDTARKGESRPNKQNKGKVLPDNLQEIFERKNILRRSQRLSKRRESDSLQSPYHHQSGSEPSRSNSSSNVHSSSVRYKPILKKNPKSIFKEISDKLSEAQNAQPEEHHQSRKVYRTHRRVDASDRNVSDQYDENAETDNVRTLFGDKNCNFHTPRCSHLKLNVNSTFCTNFINKIRVTFKKNVVNESKEIVKTEINNVNLVLSGKPKMHEKTLADSDDNDLEDKNMQNTLPVPPRNWVYHTPNNRTINATQPLNCQIKPVVILANSNRFDLYEIKPQCKMVHNHSERETAESPLGRAHFRSEVTINPSKFGFKQNKNHKLEFENGQENYATGMETYKQQCDCSRPSCNRYKPEIDRNYADNYIQFCPTSNTLMDANDFQTESCVKIGQSQHIRVNETDICDEDDFREIPRFVSNYEENSKNMFNFNNRGNMFDFG